MHRRLPPLADASTSVETSLFNIDHIQRTINSYAVNLKDRLRDIETDCRDRSTKALSSCPLWVKSGRDALKFRCPLFPRKADIRRQPFDVRFGPQADIQPQDYPLALSRF
jgi:hypothetical protein